MWEHGRLCHVVYMKTNCHVGCRNTVTLGVGTLSVMLGILTLTVRHGKHEGGVHMRVEGILK